MTRVEIVALRSVRPQLVQTLQRQGLLHLDEVSTEVENAPGFLKRLELQGTEREDLARLENLGRTLSEIAPLLSVTPSKSEVLSTAKAVSKWSGSDCTAKADEWAGKLREMTRQKADIQDQLDVLHNYHQILVDVEPALGGSKVTLGKGTRALVLQGNVDKAAARLQERFRDEIGAGMGFHYSKPSRKKLVGLLTYPEDKDAEVGRILSQEGVTPIDMSGQGGVGKSIGEVKIRIEETIEKRRTELYQVQTALGKYSSKVAVELLALKAVVSDRLTELRAQNNFAESQMITVIRGWIPTDCYASLEKAVSREYSDKAVVTQLDLHEVPHSQVPTQLRNHRWFQPFEQTLKLFGAPAYGSIDPTAMIAISFTIFYGFIVGDVFYGLVILWFAGWIRKKWGHKHEAVIAASTIGKYMGCSTIIFGFIYGEYFGTFLEKFWAYYSLPGHIPIFFHREHQATDLLVNAICFGIISIPLALVLSVREGFRHGHTKHAIEKLGMLLGLLSAIIAVCVFFKTEVFGVPVFVGTMGAAFTYLAIAMLVVGVVLIFWAMGVMGLLGVLEIMSLGGNVLSYARLMGLGIAGVVLAEIANGMPGMMPMFFAIPMAILVHLGNIALSIASPTIHSLRLNFVEFLPKFYDSKGRTFNPFRKEIVS